jgi:hypothetical protein
MGSSGLLQGPIADSCEYYGPKKLPIKKVRNSLKYETEFLKKNSVL